MSTRRQYVDALVEDTASGFEHALSPTADRALRDLLRDAFESHPVLHALVKEHAPREEVDASAELPSGDATDTDDSQKQGHG